FAKAFFGVADGSYVPVTYTFEDVVSTLNAVQPYDWATFLRARLDGHGPHAPLEGVPRGGYKLVYTEQPTQYFRESEARRRVTDLMFSLGMVVGREGRVSEVLWDSAAFKNGLVIGSEIVNVGGVAFDGERLRSAVTAAKNGAPIELLVRDGERYRTVRIDYRDGLRYPRFERDNAAPARLDQIFSPRK